MQFKGLMIAVAVTACVGAPIAVSAADTPPAAAPSASDQHQSRQKNKRICRREATTGTRLGAPRVCMTKSQWDAEETRARDDMSTMQNRQRVAVPSGPGASVNRCYPPGASC